jgi:hypothetical protein
MIPKTFAQYLKGPMDSNQPEQGKQVTIRVVSGGQVIDRFTCSPRKLAGVPTVSYRQQYWSVEDGCIYVDEAATGHHEVEPDWAQLVQDLLPVSLPGTVGACVDVLQTCFRKNLPLGIANAAASLAALRLEQQARRMLVDFFTMHRDARRLHRILQMQALFRKRIDKSSVARTSPPAEATERPQAVSERPETELDWDWSPSTEASDAPEIDDHRLRAAALEVQDRIGTYVAKESDAPIPGFDETIDWETLPANPPVVTDRNQAEEALIERTIKLGKVALDLLRYFSYNPGDKAVHAKAVLDYPISEINRLLLGSLSPYMQRDSSGG